MTVPDLLGIPVRFDRHLRAISESRGLVGFKTIVIGPQFTLFPPREQMAMLLHEAGHCLMKHLEKRLLNLWLIVWPPALLRYCQAQEYEADLFVRDCGFGPDLARAFLKIEAPRSSLHPPREARIQRLSALSQDMGDLT